MQYFVTEYGSIIRMEADSLAVLKAEGWVGLQQWEYQPSLPKRDDDSSEVEELRRTLSTPPAIPPRDVGDGSQESEINLSDLPPPPLPPFPESPPPLPTTPSITPPPHGYLVSHSGIKIGVAQYEAAMKKLEHPKQLEAETDRAHVLTHSNIRAQAARQVKQMLLEYGKDKNNAADRRQMAKAAAVTSTLGNLSGLIEFAQGEMKRLEHKINGKKKIAKISAALSEIEALKTQWNHPQMSQASYIQIARESGLISALAWHRFSWSPKARRQQATHAIENIEKQSPNISRFF